MRASETLDGRRLDLDWIRIGAFALLILYHIGMYYVPWAWHLKSPEPVEWLQPLMVLTNPWRLTVLFIVSGAATRLMMDGKPLAAFLRTRTMRLGAPLAVGMLVIVPPQTWLQLVDAGTFLPYGRFYVAYLTAGGDWQWNGAPLVTPTWNHLWFVAYIFAYTLLITGLARLLKRPPERAARLARSCPPWAGLFVLPVAYLTAVRLFIAPHFPETHAFFGDWTVHADAGAAFLFGFLAARAPNVWRTLAAWRHASLALALGAYTVYAGTLALWMGGRIDPALARATMQGVYGLDQWSWTAAIFGYGHQHLSRFDHPIRAYLTEAIFPWYLVHQTLIIGAAFALRPARLARPLEALLILIATAAGCILFHAIVRRIKWLRVAAGLKPFRPETFGRKPAGRAGLKRAA